MRRLGLFVAGAWVASTACQAEPVLQPPTVEDDEADADDDAGPDPDAPTTSPTSTTSTTSSTGDMDSTSGGIESTNEPAGSSETTAAPPGTCGDGLLDPDETCDLGYANNHDNGPCTQSCQQASCGDGLLWNIGGGTEQCDAADANNDATYNGCREDCTPGPSCGDGVLQAEEECDPNMPPGEQLADCNGTCRFDARLAFVTSSSHSGQLGGLAGADAICVAAATAAGLDRASSFLAWLSDGVDGPRSRFKDAVKDPTTPYARRDGKLLASSFESLTTSGIEHPLDVDEHGIQLAPEILVWTATAADGLPYNAQSCAMWTVNTFKESARVGQASPPPEEGAFDLWKAGDHWTSFAFYACKYDEVHLYCFED